MNTPFTPPPARIWLRFRTPPGARRRNCTSSVGRPVASSATTFVTICARTTPTPASRPSLASVRAAAPEFGFDPRGGPGFGPGRPRRWSRRSRPRGKRGDVRAAILTLLTERPMHGYEMIQEIAERTQDLWRPSPGSVYPTLQLLEDEGLIEASESEGSKKLSS